jgi:hypothetical protein
LYLPIYTSIEIWSQKKEASKAGAKPEKDWSGLLSTTCKSAGAPLKDQHGKPLGGNGNGKAVCEVKSKEGDKFLGYHRQSSGKGCSSLQNQDNLNF